MRGSKPQASDGQPPNEGQARVGQPPIVGHTLVGQALVGQALVGQIRLVAGQPRLGQVMRDGQEASVGTQAMPRVGQMSLSLIHI